MKYTLGKAKGTYKVPQRHTPDVTRANRNAAGMSLTVDRSRSGTGRTSPIVLKMIVFGTIDDLQGFGSRYMRRSNCRCCGSKTGKLELNDFGRGRLARARRRKGL